MNELVDPELIELVVNGQVDLFGELVERYQHRLQASLAGVCFDTDEIRQTAHEAFVQAFFGLNTYDPEYPFFPWLRTIALNVRRNRLRKTERRRSIVDEHLEDLRSMYPVSNEEAESSHYVLALRECLSSLPSEQRGLLEKRYRDRRPVAEIAELLDRKQGAVKMQLHRLRTVLKQCIHGKISFGESV